MNGIIAEFEEVSKLYGTFAALRKVSVRFERGRCYLVLGQNGAGKSTLLRTLAGLLKPSYGKVKIYGPDGQAEDPMLARDRIGYMSHATMLYDEFSGTENLEYFAKLYRARECVSPAEALRSVGLDPALARPVGQYSQGMKQRASLARVLISRPELLLLDEPFSNMDIQSAHQMLRLLETFRTEHRTILLTTHQRELAEPLADFVLTLHAGAVASLEEGPYAREGSAGLEARLSARVSVGGAMSSVHKTNAVRYLESLGIAYEIREYEVDPEEFSAIVVAEKVGLPAEQVFKTLLCATSDKQHVFAVVPGDAELDFKKLAAAAGARKVEMVSLKDVQPLTGYIRGGVTVFGAKKDFPVFVDETLELFDVISVSAGTRGVQVLLSPADYLRASKATVADLTKDVRQEKSA